MTDDSDFVRHAADIATATQRWAAHLEKLGVGLPPLPPLDWSRVLNYRQIRYFDGWPDEYVKEYATAYARAAVASVQPYRSLPSSELAEHTRLIAEECAKVCEQHGTGGFSYATAIRTKFGVEA